MDHDFKIDLESSLAPRVIFDPEDHVDEVIDEFVAEHAPGWRVDWDHPRTRVGRIRVSVPLVRRVGRPARAERITTNLTVRVTADEREAWKQASGGRPISDWIREQCNKALKGARK